MNTTSQQHFEQIELVGGPACGNTIPVDVAYPRFRIKRGQTWAVYEKEPAPAVVMMTRKARYVGWQTEQQQTQSTT